MTPRIRLTIVVALIFQAACIAVDDVDLAAP